jgi:hypothetical protein
METPQGIFWVKSTRFPTLESFQESRRWSECEITGTSPHYQARYFAGEIPLPDTQHVPQPGVAPRPYEDEHRPRQWANWFKAHRAALALIQLARVCPGRHFDDAAIDVLARIDNGQRIPTNDSGAFDVVAILRGDLAKDESREVQHA